jgi:hypothetical protein
VRKTPYTEAGIRRLKCVRCGERGETQWQVCADLNQYRVLCRPCDIALNRLVLEWAGFPDVETMMKRYSVAG